MARIRHIDSADIDDIETSRQPGNSKITVRLNEDASSVTRAVALGVMIVPFLGFCEGIRLFAGSQIAWQDWVLFATMYFVHMGGVTMGLHRLLTHRAYKTSRTATALLTIMGSMAGQGPALYWVSTHRRHHAFSDRPGDPHSPMLHGSDWKSRLKGLWHAHMPWMLSREVSSWAHFAPDLLRDRLVLFLNNTYFYWLFAGLALPAAAGYWIHGDLMGAWVGFIVGGLARMFLANQAAWCVGSVSHVIGGRPFNTRDNSANNWTVAVFTFGEGLQNNHHAFPSSYRHSVRWWEPDLSGWVLMILAKLGLVWDLRFPSPETVALRRK